MTEREVVPEQPRPPEPPEPQPPEPPQPPDPRQPPTTAALVPTPVVAEPGPPGGMPGQREGRPTTASEAALQLTLKWLDHTSDAAELALGDPELSEAQAQSITTFFQSVLTALQPYFPSENGRAPRR